MQMGHGALILELECRHQGGGDSMPARTAPAGMRMRRS
jgi:hypothetical protein